MSKQVILPGDKFLLTCNEAAEYFGIGEKKVRKLIQSNLGVIGVHAGNRYMVIRPKFEEFILNGGNLDYKDDGPAIPRQVYDSPFDVPGLLQDTNT